MCRVSVPIWFSRLMVTKGTHVLSDRVGLVLGELNREVVHWH